MLSYSLSLTFSEFGRHIRKDGKSQFEKLPAVPVWWTRFTVVFTFHTQQSLLIMKVACQTRHKLRSHKKTRERGKKKSLMLLLKSDSSQVFAYSSSCFPILIIMLCKATLALFNVLYINGTSKIYINPCVSSLFLY